MSLQTVIPVLSIIQKRLAYSQLIELTMSNFGEVVVPSKSSIWSSERGYAEPTVSSETPTSMNTVSIYPTFM